MRTNIEIDDELMKQAMKVSGAATKRAVVEDALRLLVQRRAQQGIRKLFGKVQWEGDLEWMRSKNKWEETERGHHAGKPVQPATRSSRKKAA
jgi:Arc/MetJ family transcription regulator